LEGCHFRFHERRIVAVTLVTHQSTFQLDVRQVGRQVAINVPFKAFNGQAVAQRTIEHPGDVFATEDHTALVECTDNEIRAGPATGVPGNDKHVFPQMGAILVNKMGIPQ